MQKLSNEDGVIAALAIDQRGSMKKMMKAATGPDNFKWNKFMTSNGCFTRIDEVCQQYFIG